MTIDWPKGRLAVAGDGPGEAIVPPPMRDMVAAEMSGPIDPRAAAMAAKIAALYPGASRAVIFYGSCLRETTLDGLMLDFYLIVSDYRAAYGAGCLALGNRILPPNVFPFEADGLIAKYAVLSEAHLRKLCHWRTDNPSLWARFAQPTRLAWAADEAARACVTGSIAQAAPALLWRARPMLPMMSKDLDNWRLAFSLTYGAELRAERGGRAGSIVDADPERYRAMNDSVLNAVRAIGREMSPRAARWRWARTRWRGKALTILRLTKASFTFAGGLDYLAWKINRHAGAAIAIRPWQRRWPILGAIILLPRLLARGAVR